MQEKADSTRRRLIRKQFLITHDQNRQIAAIASSRGKAQSDLVRDALEEWIKRQPKPDDNWKERLLNLAGAWKGEDDGLEQRFADLRRSWDRQAEPEGKPSRRRR